MTELEYIDDYEDPNATWNDSYGYLAEIERQAQAMQNVTKYISIIGGSLIITCGLIGNIVSLIVLLCTRLRKQVATVFLSALVISDIFVLLFLPLRLSLYYGEDIEIRDLSIVVCKVHTLLSYGLLQYCSWILVLITLERFTSVWLVFSSKRLCNLTSARILLGVVAMVIIIINLHWLWTIGHEDEDIMWHSGICTFAGGNYEFFLNSVYPWIDLVMFSLLPGCILLVLNALIVVKLIHAHVLRMRDMNATFEYSLLRMTTMTAILFAITIMFFVTTTPMSIYQIWNQMKEERKDGENLDPNFHIEYQRLNMWHVIWSMLQYTRSATNFLLYCVSARKFRSEVKKLFSLRRCARSPYYNHAFIYKPPSIPSFIRVQLINTPYNKSTSAEAKIVNVVQHHRDCSPRRLSTDSELIATFDEQNRTKKQLANPKTPLLVNGKVSSSDENSSNRAKSISMNYK